MDYSGLHIIAVISNPMQYQSRYKLYDIFAEDIERKGATLWTVEMQSGARPHRITKHDCDRHIQLWSSALPGELWHKENLINVALQFVTRHSPNWRYVAWVDSDIKFEKGALEKTVHALQHWDVVQMWTYAVDFGPDDEIIGEVHKSFMYCYWNNIPMMDKSGYLLGGHPGFAWAARRDALNKLGATICGGPILDFGVLGSGDRHMACALIGRVLESVHGDMHPNYRKWLKAWESNALRLEKNVGYVQNSIRHMWHGRKADRGYSSRWRVLVNNQFDPEADLARDVSGLWRLVAKCDRQHRLRDDIRRYFRSRKEDATTVR